MEPEEVAARDGMHGHWRKKPREWRATHSQNGKMIRWTTKPMKGDMQDDGTIIAEFKQMLAVVVRGAQPINTIKFKPAAMVKNFDMKTRKRFKGISNAMFKIATKQMLLVAGPEWVNCGSVEFCEYEAEKVDMVLRWGLNLAATRIFGTVKHSPETSMEGIHDVEREEEEPARNLREESSHALNRRYIRSVHKFHMWIYDGGASRAAIEATTEEFYAFALPSFTGDITLAEQMPSFPQGEEYLKELWQSNEEQESFTIDGDGETQLKMKKIVREGDGNRGPGFDQLTYRVLKQCDQQAMTDWLLLTFKVQTKMGIIFKSYKLGFISYIPKPGAPEYSSAELETSNTFTSVLQDFE